MSDDTTLPPTDVPPMIDLITPPVVTVPAAPPVAHPTDPVPAVVPPLPVPPPAPTHLSLFKEFIEGIQSRAEKIKDLVEGKVGTEAERSAVIEEVLALVKGLAPVVVMIHPDAGSMINSIVVLLTQLDNLNKRTAA